MYGDHVVSSYIQNGIITSKLITPEVVTLLYARLINLMYMIMVSLHYA